MDETKLPKWAQSELARLRADNRVLQEKLTAMGVKDGAIIVDAYSDEKFCVRESTVFQFKVGDRPQELFTVSIQEHMRRKILNVNCWFGVVHILPRAANSVYLLAEQN